MADDKKKPPSGSTPKKKSPKEKLTKEKPPTASGSTPKKKSPKEKVDKPPRDKTPTKEKLKDFGNAVKNFAHATGATIRHLSPLRSKSEDRKPLTFDEDEPRTSKESHSSRRDDSKKLATVKRRWKDPETDPETGRVVKDNSSDSLRTQGSTFSGDAPSGEGLAEKEEKDEVDDGAGARGGKED